jgi:membrane fusion protein (multidrug efflux system)
MKYLNTFPVVLISSIILSSCSSNSNTAQSDAKTSDPAGDRAVVPVKITTLQKTRIARTIDYTATILPYEEVNMAPSTPGRIEKIYVEVGDKVTKGEKLFLMDRTQLYQQKVQLSNLSKDLSRLDTLLTTGSVKQQQYDQLKVQYDVMKTNVDFMEANTLLPAPFNGVVTGKYFEDGEMYTGTPTTQTGRSAVVTVMQVNPLKVEVALSEQYYPLIKKGMKAIITADVYDGETFVATVNKKYPTINSATRSFITELELPNRNDLLKPGMFVRVSMDLGEVETFVVPANTVLVQEGTNVRYLFTARDNTAKRVEVNIGKRFDDNVEIISDSLKAGDRLISEGQARLLSGDQIEVVK